MYPVELPRVSFGVRKHELKMVRVRLKPENPPTLAPGGTGLRLTAAANGALGLPAFYLWGSVSRLHEHLTAHRRQ
jgi:hypothetical protein